VTFDLSLVNLIITKTFQSKAYKYLGKC